MRNGRRLLLLATLLTAPVIGVADAAVFQVDRVDDVPAASACDPGVADDCSLRGAILAANAAAPAASDVHVPAGQYVLTSATTCTYGTPGGGSTTQPRVQLCIMAPVKLTGAGAASTVIDGDNRDRVLYVASGVDVEVAGVTLQRGNMNDVPGTAVVGGGGINNEGTLRLVDAVVRDNRAANLGGGINNSGALTMERTTIIQNEAGAVLFNGSGFGGGIYQNGYENAVTLTVVDSLVGDNVAFSAGGGIVNWNGVADIRGSTIHRNTASGFMFGTDGGGLWLTAYEPTGHRTTVTSSTISGNLAGQHGGGIYIQGNKTGGLALQNVTVTGNQAGARVPNSSLGGGVYIPKTGVVTARNTIIAGNSSASGFGHDCGCLGIVAPSVELVSEGHNLIGDTNACFLTNATDDQLGVDAKLAPLADNGGPTTTHSLLPGSPALDAGDPAGCTGPDGQPLTADQRGFPRAVDGDGTGGARCDIGALEVQGGQTGGPTVARIQPAEGGDAAPLLAVVYGTGFAPDATAKLVRSGQPDIVATGLEVDGSGQVLLGTFDLTGKAQGSWDLVIANAGGGSATAPNAFTVAPARAPELWVDIAGPTIVRLARQYRYVLLFGNRGNTDAFAVPLHFAVPEEFLIEPRFEIAPPPAPPGTTVIQEWGGFYRELIAGEGPPMRNLMLLLPVVPAGFSGALEVTVQMPPPKDLLVAEVPFRLEVGDPLVDRHGPRPDEIAALVAGAHERADRLFDFPLPSALDGELTARLVATLGTVVEDGTASLAASFGTVPEPYALLQLSYDLTAFGMVRAQQTPPAVTSLIPPLRRWRDWLSFPSAAIAQSGCCCGAGCVGLCCEGCVCAGGPKDVAPPKNCFAGKDENGKDLPTRETDRKNCRPPGDDADCTGMGLTVVPKNRKEGICTNRPGCLFSNPIGGTCIRVPIKIRAAFDPNDKSGPAGGGDVHAIRSDVTIPYTIRFENKREATAAAADVVITDQLDATQLDLATLALGPLGFGDHTVTPPPGLSAFTTDVDLRPAMNLLVRVDAELDPALAVLTWRFTSLDPVTLEPPEDALAGFLPPNVKPPEGDGYVSFTVAAQSAVTTGATIANQARIVFDANAPIDTPVWSNAIDDTPPTSQMVSAMPVGGCSRDVVVTWSGSDEGAGVAAYEISASQDGGPFVPVITSNATSAVFSGKWGAHYVFRSIATDLAGNVQESPSAPGAEVTIPDCGPHDLAVIAMKMPAKIKLPKTRPTVKKLAKVTIQNRGVTPLVIEDAARLQELVTLAVEPLGACGPALVTLVEGKPQKPFPIVLASKKKHAVIFGVVFECVGDPATGKGHEDYRLRAEVHQAALGGEDAHPLDDVCPRTVAPPSVDPFPNGKIKEKGCGGKGANGLGGPVLVDLTVGR